MSARTVDGRLVVWEAPGRAHDEAAGCDGFPSARGGRVMVLDRDV
ncbi:hypothetical protein FHU38_000041 [Saccharomonospora amisosensis]|uniref:Uncharacterized protein n=1 Tax=Saccharomonospora amisosensis TaxID=1128677 RepID=A0A7X5UL34_9PSEU|nr:MULTISPECIES: hypothetical protein [Saccharomonospora]NIJ09697.1 hypothetical protein [Saccharomonospora amisosensis]